MAVVGRRLALQAYTVLLVLKYVVLPIDTPSQFITAWAIQVLPVRCLYTYNHSLIVKPTLHPVAYIDSAC